MQTFIGYLILVSFGVFCFYAISWITFTMLKWIHKTFFYKPPPNPQSKEM